MAVNEALNDTKKSLRRRRIFESKSPARLSKLHLILTDQNRSVPLVCEPGSWVRFLIIALPLRRRCTRRKGDHARGLRTPTETSHGNARRMFTLPP
ncbi:hypothetical protein EVAR_42749_1 [Eumeta japonica]|uniref:Uncharacterized protein n=1 Tax=Eumeta variegata TaxID=151549 RepID=A0A4C1XKA0_EUMVA|nr:hypothetical protein EVAR_42749_1 [Eumeta japonica]